MTQNGLFRLLATNNSIHLLALKELSWGHQIVREVTNTCHANIWAEKKPDSRLYWLRNTMQISIMASVGAYCLFWPCFVAAWNSTLSPALISAPNPLQQRENINDIGHTSIWKQFLGSLVPFAMCAVCLKSRTAPKGSFPHIKKFQQIQHMSECSQILYTCYLIEYYAWEKIWSKSIKYLASMKGLLQGLVLLQGPVRYCIGCKFQSDFLVKSGKLKFLISRYQSTH